MRVCNDVSHFGRSILVFLDDATMVGARRDAVVRSLVRQLDNLGPGDQMAVVEFPGKRLEVLCDWTGDRERLAAAFSAVQARPAKGIRLEVARREDAEDARLLEKVIAMLDLDDLGPETSRQTVNAPQGSGMSTSQSLAKAQIFSPGSQETIGVLLVEVFTPPDRFFVGAEAAAGAMRGLPAPPGRKMMLLLSEGFQYPFFARPVIKEASRLGYSLYPVDVQGIDTFMAQNDAENSAPRPFVYVTTERDRWTDSTLQTMAAETGGRASLNSDRLAALDRLVEDSASYYLLGFSPAWHGDDRRHGIALTVARPGLQVRTRESYVDASLRTRLTLEASSSLLLGRSPAEPRLIVWAGKLAPGAEEIPVTLGVPVEALAFVPRGDGYHAEAPVAVAVLDEKGKRNVRPGSWLETDVTQLPLRGTYARFRLSVTANRGARRIVVTVHDAVSGEALWGQARLEPEAPAAQR